MRLMIMWLMRVRIVVVRSLITREIRLMVHSIPSLLVAQAKIRLYRTVSVDEWFWRDELQLRKRQNV